MTLHGIEMIQIQARDWARVVDWYVRVFPWPIAIREDADRFCLFAAPPGGCALSIYGPPEVTLETKNRCVPGVRVENLDAVVARLRAEGVATGEISGADDYHMVTIEDPEGNEIHFYEWKR